MFRDGGGNGFNGKPHCFCGGDGHRHGFDVCSCPDLVSDVLVVGWVERGESVRYGSDMPFRKPKIMTTRLFFRNLFRCS